MSKSLSFCIKQVHLVLVIMVRYNTKFNYNEVKKAFFSGYSTILELPCFSEFNQKLLMTARRVNFLNYALSVEKAPTEYIKRNNSRVKEFIECYIK